MLPVIKSTKRVIALKHFQLPKVLTEAYINHNLVCTNIHGFNSMVSVYMKWALSSNPDNCIA